MKQEVVLDIRTIGKIVVLGVSDVTKPKQLL